MHPTPAFTYELRGPVVVIVEHDDDGPSVTNAPDAVIAELMAEGLDLDGRRVIYRDTTSTWDELLVRDNRFERFNLLHADSLAAALARLTHNRSRTNQSLHE